MVNPHVLKFYGEIDITAKNWIEQELERIEGFDERAVTILDLSSVRYVDTTFINALIGVGNRLATQKPLARVCIVAPRTALVWRLFATANLDQTFPLFDDIRSVPRFLEAPRSLN